MALTPRERGLKLTNDMHLQDAIVYMRGQGHLSLQYETTRPKRRRPSRPVYKPKTRGERTQK